MDDTSQVCTLTQPVYLQRMLMTAEPQTQQEQTVESPVAGRIMSCQSFLSHRDLCCSAHHLLLSLPHTASWTWLRRAHIHSVAAGITTSAQRFVSRSDLGRDRGSYCSQLPPYINDFLLSHTKKRHLTPAGFVWSCYLLQTNDPVEGSH